LRSSNSATERRLVLSDVADLADIGLVVVFPDLIDLLPDIGFGRTVVESSPCASDRAFIVLLLESAQPGLTRSREGIGDKRIALVHLHGFLLELFALGVDLPDDLPALFDHFFGGELADFLTSEV